MDKLMFLAANNISGGITAAAPDGGGGINARNLVTSIMGWLTFVVGVISVVFIIIGGIRYITSGGDAEKVKKAKNTVLYACIGLAVAILAGAIAAFINSTIQSGGTVTGP